GTDGPGRTTATVADVARIRRRVVLGGRAGVAAGAGRHSPRRILLRSGRISVTAQERSFLDFGGRLVVVTGASSGLGRACAGVLSEHGARILLVGRDPATLAATRRGLSGKGHEVLVLDLNHLDRI